MDEASKTNQLRSKDFFESYLSGSVLDIGAGVDLVCPGATGFDLEDGDANRVDEYFSHESFDTVHSSHSLEHMHDPVDAIQRWWKLVKTGGYLIVVVPDEDFYEQGIWPSAFNKDHKHTFRLNKPTSWSPVSHDIGQLCSALSGAKLISAKHQIFNYDHSLVFPAHLTPQRRHTRLQRLIFKTLAVIPGGRAIEKHMRIKLIKKGYPFDQTGYEASAQIEVIAQKINSR